MAKKMILEYYKLGEQPFGVTPDPRYVYLSPTYREAMASVFYGLTVNRGFTALVARPGMGKTTILFDLLRKLKSSDRTVFLFQSQCGRRGFMRAFLADLGIEDDGKDFSRMNSKLNEFLIREAGEGRRLIVVIDEAQNLSESVLEVIRMLSNFETSREKLMHIILSGQPQLAEKLSSHNLVQLRQRISIVARLERLDVEQTRHYISHRLGVAGFDRSSPLFVDKAITLIAKHSEGIPRTINNVCFNAMSLGYAMKVQKIDEKIILEVLNDLDLRKLSDQPEEAETNAGATLSCSLPSSALATAPVEKIHLKGSAWFRRPAAVAAVVGLLMWPTIRVSVYARRMLNDHFPLPAAMNSTSANAHIGAISGNKVAAATDDDLRQTAITYSASATVPNPAQASGATISKAQLVDDASASSAWEAVQVSPNQTLSRLSVLRYGEYKPGLIRQIVEMNPGLNDPDQIRSGQILRMPKVLRGAHKTAGAAPRISNSATTEVSEQ